MSPWTKLNTTVFISLLSTAALAEQDHSQDFTWGGFISQGWTISDANNLFGQSSDGGGSWDYRELGLYGTYTINPELRASGQLLSRKAGAVDDGDPAVDYLMLDWSYLQTEQAQSGIRIGRIKNPVGFYNDTRDVAFTRPSAVLPQSIYLDRARELSLSSDGAAFYYRRSTDIGYFSFEVQYGVPQSGENTERTFLGRDWNGRFDNADLLLLRAMYEEEGGKYRFALSRVDANLPFKAGSANAFTDGTLEFSLSGISAQFNAEHWSLTTEWVMETSSRKDFGGFFNPADNHVQAYYVQLDHRFDSKWSTFLRYDEVLVDKDDPDGSIYHSLTGYPAYQRFAKDWTIGVGYQPSPHWLFRAELHNVDGTAWLSKLDNPSSADTKQRWNVAILQASYRF